MSYESIQSTLQIILAIFVSGLAVYVVNKIIDDPAPKCDKCD